MAGESAGDPRIKHIHFSSHFYLEVLILTCTVHNSMRLLFWSLHPLDIVRLFQFFYDVCHHFVTCSLSIPNNLLLLFYAYVHIAIGIRKAEELTIHRLMRPIPRSEHNWQFEESELKNNPFSIF